MSDQPSYYERVTKPKRQRERQAKLAKLGVSRLPMGPGRKYGPDRLELHLKLSGPLAHFFSERSSDIGHQAFFEQIVQREFDGLQRIRENS